MAERLNDWTTEWLKPICTILHESSEVKWRMFCIHVRKCLPSNFHSFWQGLLFADAITLRPRVFYPSPCFKFNDCSSVLASTSFNLSFGCCFPGFSKFLIVPTERKTPAKQGLPFTQESWGAFQPPAGFLLVSFAAFHLSIKFHRRCRPRRTQVWRNVSHSILF